MAPVPKTSCALQPKQVDVFDNDHEGFTVKVSSTRPCFEKMSSCDYSVEASSESSEDEEVCPWTVNPFSVKSTEDKAYIFQNLLVKLQEKPEPESLDLLDEKLYKLGALDQVKTRSPTENDDYSSLSSSPSKDAINTQWGVSCSSLCSEKKKPCEGEQPESVECLVPSSSKKPVSKQRKGKKAPANKSVEKPKPKTSATSKKNGVIKRQSIGKKKRNTYEILCPDTQSPLPKKIRVQRKTASKRRSTNTRSQKNSHTSVSSSTSSGMPSGYKCVDSGVSTGNSFNSAGSSEGGSFSDGGNGGSSCGGGGGGGGFYKKGGMGGNGGDDSEDKKPLSVGDVNMKDDEEDEDDDDDTKMSSKEGSGMDCNEGQDITHSVPWQSFDFKTQDLQHSAYCRNDTCGRPLCQEMKREIQHIESHKSTVECHRCHKTLNLLKYHAAQCKMPCCRVYQCNMLRENKDVLQEPAQVVHHAPSPLPPQPIPIWNYNQPVYNINKKDIDGFLVYNNTGSFIEKSFQETISYIKGEKIGNGRNGYVYKAHFPATSPLYNKPMVVKETEYRINKEELEVYKNIGDHPNIVKHNLVTMKGHEGHACIFMEECDKSLKDLCQEHDMDDREAIFYWHQVVDAVGHLHEKGIIHKDIKAQNVLLSGLAGNGEYFRARLADFDAAKILESECTAGGLKPMGTPGFASPEVMQSLPHGRPADIFSLGCLLMELKGVVPKENELSQQITKLVETNPFVGHLVKYCVHQDPFSRPTASDIQRFLQASVPDAL